MPSTPPETYWLPSPLHGSDCMWCGIMHESGQAAAGFQQEAEAGAAPGAQA
ncbi:hypothetical protein ABT127_29880 [Streptomyces sp. NPDC001904]|uniref:hypothetical protein n=1 Tax=Streptomyces sp. NPDC001904 TaxID=3154531 RepID=UPI00332C2993